MGKGLTSDIGCYVDRRLDTEYGDLSKRRAVHIGSTRVPETEQRSVISMFHACINGGGVGAGKRQPEQQL